MLHESPHGLSGICSVAPGPGREGGRSHTPWAIGVSSADWADGAHAPGPGEIERRKWLSTALRGLVIYEEQLPRAIWTRNFRKHILCVEAQAVWEPCQGGGRGWGSRNGAEPMWKEPRQQNETDFGFLHLQKFGQDPNSSGPQSHQL